MEPEDSIATEPGPDGFILAFIEDEEMIDRILEHLGLWEVKAGLSTKVKALSQLTTHS